MDEGIRIVIADPNAESRARCRALLTEEPEYEYMFLEAGTGEEAVRLFTAEDADCILTDYQLSDMDAVGLLDALTDEAGEVRTSVVVLIDSGKKTLARKVVKRGAHDFLMKDQVSALLLSRVVRFGVEMNWARKRLREQRILFRTILMGTPGLLALKNKNLVYQAVNPAFCEFLGMSPIEVVGKSDLELFPGAEGEAYCRIDNKVMETGLMETREEEVTGAEGKRLLQVSRSPIVDSDGVTAGVFFSARTIPKGAKKDAGVSGIRVAAAPEKRVAGGPKAAGVAPTVVAEEPPVACRFLPSYKLTWVDEAFCEYFSKPDEQLVGTSFRAMVPEVDHDLLNKHLAMLTRDRPEGKHQHGAVREGNEVARIEWAFKAKFNEKNRLIEYHAVGRPVVAKQEEEEMKECPECAEQVRAKAAKCRYCGHVFAEDE